MFFFLKNAFHIRNLKRSTIDQLIDHEEKSLHTTRYHSRTDENDQSNINININNNNNNNSNNNGTITNRHSALITPHHLTRIPKSSILDHQQVFNLNN